MTTENNTTHQANNADELSFSRFSKDRLLMFQVEIALARVVKHGEDMSILLDAIKKLSNRNEALDKENHILKNSILELLALKA